LGEKVIYLLFFLLFFSFASAESLPTHQIETDLTIYQECFNCTYCNFTTFKGPDGSNLLTNMVATASDTHYSYLINSGNITEQGTYRYCYNCGSAADAESGCIDVPVTYTGQELNMPQTIIYIVILVFLSFLLFYIIWIYPSLPNHSTNSDGYVISANSLAYLRPIALGFMWILVQSITYIVANISVAYITSGFLGNFIFGIWQIMMYANLVILPIWIVWIINDIYKTAKLKEFIERGGNSF